MYEYFIILHNLDYIQTRCNDRRNTYMNTYTNNKICLSTCILVSISPVYKQI